MKNLILLTILLIVLTSLCEYLPLELPQLPSDQVQPGANVIQAETPDIFLRIELTSSEITAGRDLQILFEITNKQAYDLKNVVLESYDHPCFTQTDDKFSENIGTLKGNRTNIGIWKWKSDTDLFMDKNCPIKFSLNYTADYSYFQDIAVLSESEYYQRELAGTLKDIPIQSSSTVSPLGISIEFSEEQPLLENQNYYMYINYYNTGKGFITVNKGDIEIDIPGNIENLDCGDYSSSIEASEMLEICQAAYGSICDNTTCSSDNSCWEDYTTCDITGAWNPDCDFNYDGVIDVMDIGTLTSQITNVLSLNKSLTFIRGKAIPSTCNFTTSDVSTIDIKSLSLTANYKYLLDNSISVRVKK